MADSRQTGHAKRQQERKGRPGGLGQDDQDHRGGSDAAACRIRCTSASSTSARSFTRTTSRAAAKLGDVVRIIECRPMSKLKRWQLGRSGAESGAGGACEPGGMWIVEDCTNRRPDSKSLRRQDRERKEHHDWDANHSRGGRQQRRAQAVVHSAARRRSRDCAPAWATSSPPA